MKSITIHNIDDRVYERIAQVAASEDSSLNSVIKQLLHRSLGLSVDLKKNDVSAFAGKWSNKEYREMQKSQELFETVDQNDWK